MLSSSSVLLTLSTVTSNLRTSSSTRTAKYKSVTSASQGRSLRVLLAQGLAILGDWGTRLKSASLITGLTKQGRDTLFPRGLTLIMTIKRPKRGRFQVMWALDGTEHRRLLSFNPTTIVPLTCGVLAAFSSSFSQPLKSPKWKLILLLNYLTKLSTVILRRSCFRESIATRSLQTRTKEVS